MRPILRRFFALALLVFCAQSLSAQLLLPSPAPERPKANIRYIIIYRNWVQGLRSSGGSATIAYEWTTEIAAFETFDALNNWLNGKDWMGKPKAAIGEDQLIGAYELSDARKMDLKFEKEQKSSPKRVEIQEEKWEETRWKIKRND